MFVDTSVLLCAHDLDAGEKRAIAEHVLRTLWTDRSGTLSVQVLEEFYDAFTARAATAAAKRVARDLVEVYSAWRVAALDAADLLAACDHAERYQVHVRDATILVAARKVREQCCSPTACTTAGMSAAWKSAIRSSSSPRLDSPRCLYQLPDVGFGREGPRSLSNSATAVSSCASLAE